jgi:hypothetical protein
MQRPEWVTNEPQWIKYCCQIRARAEHLVAGRLAVIEAARALARLIFWRRGQADPDLAVFAGDVGPDHWDLGRSLHLLCRY